MSLLNDLRVDLGDDGGVFVPTPPATGTVSVTPTDLIGDLRADLGDDGGGFIASLPASGSVTFGGSTKDLRVDIGDDGGTFIATPPATGTVTLLNGLVRDLRVDLGDDALFNNNGNTPEIWGSRYITGPVYNKQPDDVILFVDTSSAVTINLSLCPVIGQICVIKDATGNADVNFISIVPPLGVTIDGFSRFLITQRYQSFHLTWNGTEYNII